MGKRGRKPKVKRYFAEEQEKAVADYIRSNDVEEKNQVGKQRCSVRTNLKDVRK